jgi:hypothetical protein
MKAVLTLDNGENLSQIFILSKARNNTSHVSTTSTSGGLWKSLTKRSHELLTRW